MVPDQICVPQKLPDFTTFQTAPYKGRQVEQTWGRLRYGLESGLTDWAGSPILCFPFSASRKTIPCTLAVRLLAVLPD